MSQALRTPPTSSDDRERIERRRLRPRHVIVRAAVCELQEQRGIGARPQFDGDIVDHLYQGCLATRRYLARSGAVPATTRAAVNPAMTSVASWAVELVQSAVLDFLAGMQRNSAFAALLARPGVLVVANDMPTKVPGRSGPWAAVGGWVAEGSPKPVGVIGLTSITLTPRRLAGISVFTEETLEYSVPAIEALVEQALRHDLGALLDQSPARQRGGLDGETGRAAQWRDAAHGSAATPSAEAMYEDLGVLAGAVGTGHPDARVTYLANPVQAGRMAASGYDAIATGFLAAGTVVAVDAVALAMTVANPSFLVSGNASLHMETSPLPLVTGEQGSGVLATPMRSLFQTDALALRATIPAAWMVRRSGAVAAVTGATW